MSHVRNILIIWQTKVNGQNRRENKLTQWGVNNLDWGLRIAFTQIEVGFVGIKLQMFQAIDVYFSSNL